MQAKSILLLLNGFLEKQIKPHMCLDVDLQLIMFLVILIFVVLLLCLEILYWRKPCLYLLVWLFNKSFLPSEKKKKRSIFFIILFQCFFFFFLGYFPCQETPLKLGKNLSGNNPHGRRVSQNKLRTVQELYVMPQDLQK